MRVTRSIALATLATLGAATCGKDSTTPSTSPTPAATSISITAPATIAPGATVQLALIATLAGGSTKDVTSSAIWSSGNSSYLTVSSSGQATGQRLGPGQVLASYLNLHTAQNVNILAPNTYEVSGRVLDQGAPLAGANVTAYNGTTALGHLTTSSNGAYEFWGVASSFALEIDEYGYTTQTVNETVSANGMLPDITLQETAPSVDLSGAWTLALAADPSCAAALPPDAQSRTYTLNVTEQGTHFTGIVSSATLSPRVSFNDGRVIGSAFSFDYNPSGGYYYYYSQSADALSTGRWVTIGGIVTGTATGSSFVVPFSGSFLYYTGTPNGQAQAACSGPNGTASFQRGSSTAAKRGRR